MRGRQTNSMLLKSRASPLRSNRGFTLVEVSITVIVAAIGIFGMTSLFSDMIKIQKRSAVLQVVTQMRGELIAAISNANTSAGVPSAWDRTVADVTVGTGTPFLICLRDSTPCIKDAPTPLNLKAIDGAELFHSIPAARGFTFDGLLCNSFSMGTPDPACPMRWDIQVQTRCPGATTASCVNPVVEVSGRLLYSPGDK